MVDTMRLKTRSVVSLSDRKSARPFHHGLASRYPTVVNAIPMCSDIVRCRESLTALATRSFLSMVHVRTRSNISFIALRYKVAEGAVRRVGGRGHGVGVMDHNKDLMFT